MAPTRAPKLAYVVSRYPAISHTFILREVLALRARGVEVGTFTVRQAAPEDALGAIAQAEAWMAELRVPVVIEVILERVTNISMGTEIDNVVEFEELAQAKADVPTAIAAALLD